MAERDWLVIIDETVAGSLFVLTNTKVFVYPRERQQIFYDRVKDSGGGSFVESCDKTADY